MIFFLLFLLRAYCDYNCTFYNFDTGSHVPQRQITVTLSHLNVPYGLPLSIYEILIGTYRLDDDKWRIYDRD